jgi:hypothetical protein
MRSDETKNLGGKISSAKDLACAEGILVVKKRNPRSSVARG